jgi:hypothetical protein
VPLETIVTVYLILHVPVSQFMPVYRLVLQAQEYPPTFSVHWAPFRHGLDTQYSFMVVVRSGVVRVVVSFVVEIAEAFVDLTAIVVAGATVDEVVTVFINVVP